MLTGPTGGAGNDCPGLLSREVKRGPIVDDDATMNSNDGDRDSGSTKGTGLRGGDNVRRDEDWGSTDDDEADDRGAEPSEEDPVARGTEDCWQ